MKKLVPILFFLVLVHVSYAEDTITAGLLALDERVEIKKNIVQFSDNGKLDKSDESYLDTLLEKAKESKCLNSMLQLVKGLDKNELINYVVDINSNLAARKRNVQDVLALLLTYFIIDDYERTLGSLSSQLSKENTLFILRPELHYPLEAKKKLLEGKIKVLIIQGVRGQLFKGAIAAYLRDFDTMLFYTLPSPTKIYELDVVEEDGGRKRAHPAAVILHESFHGGEQADSWGYIFGSETKGIFVEALYIATKKGSASTLKDIKDLQTSLKKFALNGKQQILNNGWNEEIALLYFERMEEPVSRYLEAAIAFLDYVKEPSDEHKKKATMLEQIAQGHHRRFESANSLFVVLQKATRFNKGELPPIFTNVPELTIKGTQVLVEKSGVVYFEELTEKLISHNIPIIMQILKNPANLFISYEDSLIVKEYYAMYAFYVLLAIRNGNNEVGKEILETVLMPFIEFVNTRTFMGDAGKKIDPASLGK